MENEIDWKKIEVRCSGKQTAEEFLDSVPETSRAVLKEAILKCMAENLPLIHPCIYETARELTYMRDQALKRSLEKQTMLQCICMINGVWVDYPGSKEDLVNDIENCNPIVGVLKPGDNMYKDYCVSYMFYLKNEAGSYPVIVRFVE